jgi:CheY-like chemotaxis protein
VPKILIVEDELLIAQDIVEIVERAGHNTTPTAKTAMDAVRLATLHQPDIVLMDINLGSGSDGVEAAMYITQELLLPIIFLTSQTDVDTLERAKHAQPYGYLSKPVREADVVSNITIALHQHAQKQQDNTEQDSNTLRGRIEMIGGMGALLEMIKSLHNRGGLRFDDGAVVYVADGKIVHVLHPSLEPEAALTQMLQRGQGTFSFDPEDVSEMRSLSRDITTLVLNMAKDSDETARDASVATTTTNTASAKTPSQTPTAPTLAGYPFSGEVILDKHMSQPHVRGNGVVVLPDKQRVSEFKATLRPLVYEGTATREGQEHSVQADVRVSNVTDADEPLALECQFVSTGLTVNVLD